MKFRKVDWDGNPDPFELGTFTFLAVTDNYIYVVSDTTNEIKKFGFKYLRRITPLEGIL